MLLIVVHESQWFPRALLFLSQEKRSGVEIGEEMKLKLLCPEMHLIISVKLCTGELEREKRNIAKNSD